MGGGGGIGGGGGGGGDEEFVCVTLFDEGKVSGVYGLELVVVEEGKGSVILLFFGDSDGKLWVWWESVWEFGRSGKGGGWLALEESVL